MASAWADAKSVYQKPDLAEPVEGAGAVGEGEGPPAASEPDAAAADWAFCVAARFALYSSRSKIEFPLLFLRPGVLPW